MKKQTKKNSLPMDGNGEWQAYFVEFVEIHQTKNSQKILKKYKLYNDQDMLLS